MIRNIEFAHSNIQVPFISCKLTGLVRIELLQKIHDGNELDDSEQKNGSGFIIVSNKYARKLPMRIQPFL